MYVVTFYSFKGGVGRSMSLVNVGVQLAQSGRKVLLVDFDLEAPGLPTFSLKKPDEDISGIVEYVSQYIATGESPDVKNYVYESEKFEGGGSLFVMPAGKQDSSYSHRLNLIDWRKLYSEQSGYLFFEDLKRQWAKSLSPDYVLIDSRTGHSDVEGICTRQLPNAVSLLFFPNEQNLHGLKRIVANINADNEQEQKQNEKITVHFAVSNVPDLDDEDQILGKTMSRFQKELGYKKLAAEIHHYNSLSLLNQQIFSLARPNSRLTKEYSVLTQEITKHNLGDREAALVFLKSAHRDIEEVMDDDAPNVLNDKIQTLLTNFPRDGEIGFRVALVFEQLGNSYDALSMLSGDKVEPYYATAPMYATRARLNHRLNGNEDMNGNEDTVRDLNAMLDADGATLEMFLEVLPLMEQFGSDLFDKLPNSKAFSSLSARDQMFLAFQFEGNVKQLKANATIIKRLRKEKLHAAGYPSDYLSHELALASIGIGDFSTAIDNLKPKNGESAAFSIYHAFNLAMAMWGKDGTPSIEYFKLVVKLNESTEQEGRGANYYQCIALAYVVLGNPGKANFYLDKARKASENETARLFSAWSYTKVTPQIFLSHLNEIEKCIDSEYCLPRFILDNHQVR